MASVSHDPGGPGRSPPARIARSALAGKNRRAAQGCQEADFQEGRRRPAEIALPGQARWAGQGGFADDPKGTSFCPRVMAQNQSQFVRAGKEIHFHPVGTGSGS